MKQLALDIGLSTRPTLDSFLVGANQAACNHLRLWVDGGMRAPVPTYLWGDTGSGKSHLLHAVHQALSDQGLAVGWIDSHHRNPPEFSDAWAAVLMDDVQLYNPEQQHIAFNWVINALSPDMGAPRWVLACGQMPPTDLPVRDDLRSRLGWGHVYGLVGPDDVLRRAVLRQAAEARGLFLSDDVIGYMLSRFSRDLSSLIELLDHLDSYALQTQRALTIPLVRAMLDTP